MLQQIDNAIAFSVVMLMLSLIITAVVQVITALTDLRGRNLASGLSNLLRQIEPEFRQRVPGRATMGEYIADVVVSHPAIAHAGTRAKAVSQSELISVLRDLCSPNPATEIDEKAKITLKKLLDERVPCGGEIAAAAQALAQQLGSQLQGQKAEVKAAVDAVFGTVSKLEHQVGQWFDTVMDRLSDIFTRTTRVITVSISLLFVLALQIDSGEILQQITNSPELRARLTAMTDPALSQASKIFDNPDRAKAALTDVKNNHTGRSTDQDKQIVAALEKAPTDLSSCVAGKRWFGENAKMIPSADTVQKEFDDACQNRTLQAAGNSYQEIAKIHADLMQADLKIIPAQIGGQNVFDSWAHWCAAFGVRRHLAGILASIVFLSLGAPFWFNTLRQLSNLKPAIAEKVGKTKQEEAKEETSGAN
jgi:hypothetical protein